MRRSPEAKLRLMVQESDRWLRRCEVVLEGSGQDLLEVLGGGTDGAVRELGELLAERLERMAKVARKMGGQVRRACG